MATFYLNDLDPATSGCAPDNARFPPLPLAALFNSPTPLLYACVSNFLFEESWFEATLRGYLAPAREGLILIHEDEVGPGEQAARNALKAAGLPLPSALGAGLAARLGAGWVSAAPNNLLPRGSHHSKFLVLVYHDKLRLAILSNNFLWRDQHRKTGSVSVCDFPRKEAQAGGAGAGGAGGAGAGGAGAGAGGAGVAGAGAGAGIAGIFGAHPLAPAPPAFESALLSYFDSLRKGGCPTQPLIDLISQFDFSGAPGHLITSVPAAGAAHDTTTIAYNTVRRAVSADVGPLRAGELVFQYSSMGSIAESFVENLVLAFSGGGTNEPASLRCVWPTTDLIRRSNEGWVGGSSCPSDHANFTSYLINRLYPYDATASGRGRSVPHIKTAAWVLPMEEARPPVVPGGREIAAVYTGSHNFSQAAWGQENTNVTTVRSYELGILITGRSFAAGAAVQARQVAAGRLPSSPFTLEASPAAAPGAVVRLFPAAHGPAGAAAVPSRGRLVPGGANGAQGPVVIVPVPLPHALPAQRMNVARGPDDGVYDAALAVEGKHEIPWRTRDRGAPELKSLDSYGFTVEQAHAAFRDGVRGGLVDVPPLA
jgi:hypothetical protein